MPLLLSNNQPFKLSNGGNLLLQSAPTTPTTPTTPTIPTIPTTPILNRQYNQSNFVALAKRLLENFGRDIKVTSSVLSDVNPWTTSSSPRVYNVFGIKSELDPEYKFNQAELEIKEKFIWSCTSDNKIIEIGDEFEFEGVSHTIKEFSSLNPNGTGVIIYEVYTS